MQLSPAIRNILLTASILSVVVTVLVIVNTPSSSSSDSAKPQNKTGQLIKTFIVSFVLCSLVLYIMYDNDQNAMMTNIIKGEPDF